MKRFYLLLCLACLACREEGSRTVSSSKIDAEIHRVDAKVREYAILNSSQFLETVNDRKELSGKELYVLLAGATNYLDKSEFLVESYWGKNREVLIEGGIPVRLRVVKVQAEEGGRPEVIYELMAVRSGTGTISQTNKVRSKVELPR